MSLFQNTYRIETTRLTGWDYSGSGVYFITICTKNKRCLFGSIENREMMLNDIGVIVQNEWLQTPSIRPDMNLELEEFTVMPNHFHGIIVIGANEYNCVNKDTSQAAETTNDRHIGPQSKNMASIIRGFKSAVTAKSRKINPAFAWQERYHDHIIRNEESHLKIRHYIQNNAANWLHDKFYMKE
jgi:putative transposase